MRKIIQTIKRHGKTLTFSLGLGLAVAGLGGLTIGGGHKAFAAQDCDNNAIIRCGVSSPQDLINKINQNATGDLPAVYNAYSLPAASYARFASSARPGTAYKDGRIVVDNQVVATGSSSIGRQAGAQGPGYFSRNIGGRMYYGNVSSRAFAADSIPVYALFDGDGLLQAAILTSCGNPMDFNRIPSAATCNELNMSAVAGKLNTYNFTANAAQSGNAVITKYTYDFGDGQSVTTTNPAQVVTHQYTKAGNFTARLTISVSLPGNNQKTITSGGCQKTVTVTIPFYQCIQLAGTILDKSKYSYAFTATAKYGNGAKPVSATFNFGDGQTVSAVKVNADGKTFTTQHAYATGGTYNASATLYFNVPGQAQPVAAPQKCPAVVTPETVTPECKPGVPIGSPECTPCEYNSSLPPNSPECVPPSLPNTGAGNVIAITAIVVIGGFLGYRHVLYRKHKAAFEQAVIGTSPLPLGDPLNDAAPLTGTPLARKLKSLGRRKRPF